MMLQILVAAINFSMFLPALFLFIEKIVFF